MKGEIQPEWSTITRNQNSELAYMLSDALFGPVDYFNICEWEGNHIDIIYNVDGDERGIERMRERDDMMMMGMIRTINCGDMSIDSVPLHANLYRYRG